MDVVVSGRQPRPRLPRTVPVIAVALLVTGLVAADEVRDARAREATVDLALVGARPMAALFETRAVQDAVVGVSVRNTGPTAVVVLDQRLDGGGPADPGPAAALTVGATAVLAVRWRVLCAEVGTLFGPRTLDLTVRPRRGGGRVVSLPLPPPARAAFRRAGSDACAP